MINSPSCLNDCNSLMFRREQKGQNRVLKHTLHAVIHHGIPPRDLLFSGVIAREARDRLRKKQRYLYLRRSFSQELKVSSLLAVFTDGTVAKLNTLVRADNLRNELLSSCFRSCILQFYLHIQR